MTAVPTPPRGSLLRLLTGVVLLVVALTTALLGFFRLISVLDNGGYGTSAMRYALVVLGGAGALLAGGVATLIWEIAQRYETGTRPGTKQ